MLAPDAKLIHPGTVLRDRVLPGLGLSVIHAARGLHICRQTLHRIRAGCTAITPDMAARLSRLTGVPAQFWLNLRQAYDLARAEANLSDMLPRIRAHAPPPALMKELTAYAH